MTTAVYKYEVPVDDESHMLPGRIEHVAAKDTVTLWVWCLVHPDDLSDLEPYRVFGTGQPVPNEAIYNGTAIAPPFVWHIFNVSEVSA